MTFLSNAKDAPLDPITGLDQLFRDDPAAAKINLVVGVWQDEFGVTPVLKAVKKAEERLLRHEDSKNYIPMAGELGFRTAVHDLVFGADHRLVSSGRVSSLHTPGGTGALRIAAEFIRDHSPEATLWITSPAYPNHKGIFEAVGLATASYRYYDVRAGRLLFDELLEDLTQCRPGDVVVLHGCCHNPTGADLSDAQWNVLAKQLAASDVVPFVDLAYLGFSRRLELDSVGARTVFEACGEGILTTSFSKNFGLYSERTGVVSFIAATEAAASRCAERAKIYSRKIYSSPPSHGSRIVTEVLTDPDLRAIWVSEVGQMRDRLAEMRQSFAAGLAAHQVDSRVAPALTENVGMFALTLLTPDHVTRLKERHHVYMPPNGRVSIAGMREATMDQLCEAISDVLKDLPLPG